MSTGTTHQGDGGRSENPPDTFASVHSQIDRMFTETQRIERQIKKDLQEALSAVSLAIDSQLKEAVSAAEHVVRKQVQLDLRTKYGKELELALTEKSLIERRFQTATKQFEDQKQALAAKLAETEEALARLEKDSRHTEADRGGLETSLRRANEKLL